MKMLGNTTTFQLLVASSVVALATVYVFYGATTGRKKRRKGLCVGLANLGNSCFLNAVLQALAPCQTVHEWLHNMLLKSGGNNSAPCLVYALHNVWKVLNNRSSEVADRELYSPTEVLDALRLHNWCITPDQQDAHELFHVLTETLSEETGQFPALLSLFDVTALQEVEHQPATKARNRVGTRIPVLPPRSLHPFRGLLAQKLQCTVCGHKNPVRYENFDSLSLTIPHMMPTMLSVELLLKQFITPERVHEVQCESCHRRKGGTQPPKSTFLKTVSIGKLPPCLCLHIQRTQCLPNGLPMKSPVPVHYPQRLNMAPYVFPGGDRYSQERVLRALAGLVGGNADKQATTQRLRQPYPKQVCDLKALHYTHQYCSPGLGISLKTADSPCQHGDNSKGYPHRIHTASDPQKKEAAQSEREPQNTAQGVTAQQSKLFKSSEAGDLSKVYSSLAQSQKSSSFSKLFGAAHKDRYAASVGAPPPNTYKLMSVIEHYGDVFSGHFVTFRRGPNTADGSRAASEQWLFISDASVRKVSTDRATTAEAYMLFYERSSSY